MSLVLPNPTLGTGVVDPTDIEDNFTEIASKINGNLDNSDIKSGANIDINKLSASYEWMIAKLAVIGTTPSANSIIGLCPIYNDGKGTWTVAAINWVCPDVGGKDCTFQVHYGNYGDDGLWASTSSTSTTTVTGPAGVADAEGYQGACTLNTLTAVAPSTTPMKSLAIKLIAQGTNVANLYVAVHLKRQITGA